MLTSDIVRVHPVCVHGFVRLRTGRVLCVCVCARGGGACVRARLCYVCGVLLFDPVQQIANRIKAKGLTKLRWYCQLCEKACRDENGYKCHTQVHLRCGRPVARSLQGD